MSLFGLPPDLVPAVDAQLANPSRELPGADAILGAIRPTEIDILWDRAKQYFQGERYDEAAVLLDVLAQRTPADATVFRSRAQVRWRTGDYRGAMADFDAARRLNGDDAEVALRAAEFFTEMGFPDRALDCCRPLTSRADAEPDVVAGAFFLMGGIDLNRANYDGALENFTRAIGADPGWPEPHARRGFLHLMLGRGGEADQDFAEAARLRSEAASDGAGAED